MIKRIIVAALATAAIAVPASAQAAPPTATFGPPVPILNTLIEQTGWFTMADMNRQGVVSGTVQSFSTTQPGAGSFQVEGFNRRGRCVYTMSGQGTYKIGAHESPLSLYRPLVIVTGPLCENLDRLPL